MKDWKTTTAGILSGLILILPEIINAIQGHPVDTSKILAGITIAAGLSVAADAKNIK
jgi:hypothetical protein